MTVTKFDLLEYLRRGGGANSLQVAAAFGVDYATAAMALLRLSRQGHASRALDPEDGLLWYELTERGLDRLAYLQREI
jgi:DNA-binding MarR family transcriptional regulator